MQKTYVLKVLNVNKIHEGYSKLQIIGMDDLGFMDVINEAGEHWKYHPNASMSYMVTDSLVEEEEILNEETKDNTNVENTKFSRPRGWRLMNEFVDADGTVYHKGIDQPHLKGSLPVYSKNLNVPNENKNV